MLHISPVQTAPSVVVKRKLLCCSQTSHNIRRVLNRQAGLIHIKRWKGPEIIFVGLLHSTAYHRIGSSCFETVSQHPPHSSRVYLSYRDKFTSKVDLTSASIQSKAVEYTHTSFTPLSLALYDSYGVGQCWFLLHSSILQLFHTSLIYRYQHLHQLDRHKDISLVCLPHQILNKYFLC